MQFFFQLLILGILIGSIYSMVAMGFVLIYKASRVVNFAQGELLMIGAYFCLEMVVRLQLHIIPAFITTLLFMSVFAVLLERLVLRRMMNAPVMSVVMATIGVGIVLRAVVMLYWGTSTLHFPAFIPDDTVNLGIVKAPRLYVYSFALSVAVVAVFGAFFQYSRMGLVMRATASSPTAARSVGVPLTRVFALAWVIAAMVSAAGGVLAGQISGLTPEISAYGVKVFPAVILGGLDSIVGTAIAGLIIGVLDEFGNTSYLRDLTGLSGLGSVAPFAILILILWVRPNGLFGSKEVERL